MLAEYALCVVGIYSCFLTWGLLQERVTATPYTSALSPTDPSGAPVYFRSFIVLNLLQSLLAALVGAIYLFLFRGQSLGPRHPSVLKRYFGVALFNSLASPFGYAALKYIDYPTMILGKSCKLLPVMAMAVLVHRATFPRHQVAAVALVTLGVSAFMLLHDQEGKGGKAKGAASNSLWGLFLLGINLAIDGLTNSTQDAMFKTYRISGQQMMVMMNLASALLMSAYLALPWLSNNELAVAWAFVNQYPAVLKDMVMFAGAGALGQVFIFHTLGRFGSLSLVTITVTRKMFSIILSVVMYDHRISLGQWAAVAVVFVGIALESYGKKAKKQGAGAGAVGKVELVKEKTPVPVDSVKVAAASVAASATGVAGKATRVSKRRV
ncbi:UAA transporter [Catenaria anguillulae PL171]|uniref:UDP-galactose transporter homolog 1 n=1 Tax=Catenaria anguillulae PL171 TaxID=765915 RepID=A0A1Y2HH61_9FUNG|nr:UAA transporter [Catenaria anguillulae PL171]